uniref:Uncharacterized protein n=1 Tax=Arundo donax TaxID=35708 RepID=A0A0A9E6X6_ARUDO
MQYCKTSLDFPVRSGACKGAVHESLFSGIYLNKKKKKEGSINHLVCNIILDK